MAGHVQGPAACGNALPLRCRRRGQHPPPVNNDSSSSVAPARLGILLSGGGSTYANLASACAAGSLPAEIAVVIGSKPCAGVDRAAAFGHEHHIATAADQITDLLLAARCDLVLMCGWLRFYDPPAALAGKVLNIHPSLLPNYGGKGMYGRRVHEAVVAAGDPASGCTVHLVDGAYDSGPILAQRRVAVPPGATADAVQELVMSAERHLYPLVVLSCLTHGIAGSGRDRWLVAVPGCDGHDSGFRAPAQAQD